VTDRKPKVLLIDDSLDTLDLVEVFLYRDFDVVTAENGFEGFNRAQELLPDLVITDIMMPVMDGVRLFNDLRRQEKTAAIPVIAMTSFLKRITRKSLLTMGFNGVVAKPIDRQKLLQVIGKALSIPSLFKGGKVTDETQS
jgi:CheY-like chemotaxis protein